MQRLSIREMRASLGRIDEIVEREGEILITCHGRPLARVVPVRRSTPMPSRRSLRETMDPLVVTSAELLREERDDR